MSEKHIDELSGVETTGHSWDGIRELNNPMPRWWVWTFYACIVWALAYTVVYPSWPGITTNVKGYFGWSSRGQLATELTEAQATKAVYLEKIAATPVADILKDEELNRFATAGGAAAFKVNCTPCHGSGAAGGNGYPNLNDDDWMWGGSLAQIQQTILHGIRSTDPDAHVGDMPAFGRDGLLQRPEIVAVADYVRSLSNLPVPQGVTPDLAKGKEVFAANCAACHGADGKGNVELGAPNLTDGIWLYGSDRDTIIATLTNGRAGIMPAWAGRLDPTTIKALTVYVHALGGGQ